MTRTSIARRARRAADESVQARARVIAADGLTTKAVDGYQFHITDLIAAALIVAVCFFLVGAFLPL